MATHRAGDDRPPAIHTIIEPERHAAVDETLAAIAGGQLVEPHEATRACVRTASIMPVALTVSLVRGADGIVRWDLDHRSRQSPIAGAAEAERDALLREPRPRQKRAVYVSSTG